MYRLLRSAFWRISIFRIIVVVSSLFFLLTILAMLLYPGGTVADPHTQGYSFFLNFLSDLGRTSTPSGQSNFAARILFTCALTIIAPGFALFFVTFVQFFPDMGLALRLSQLGAICGSITSLCFIAVALLPTNLYRQAHNLFVNAAFLSFLVAVLFFFLAILLTDRLPRQFAWVFGLFLLLLAGYVLLLLFGPAATTLAGEIVQATGQKIIVYASILTILIQAFNVRQVLLKKR